MKIAKITDNHFGVSKGSNLFLQSSLAWFKDFFIPELKKRNIDTIVHLGDLFDNRSSLDIKVLNEVLSLFRNELSEFKIHLIVGNHDIAYRDRIDVNSIECLRGFPNVTIIDKNTMLDADIALCPWVVNKDELVSFLVENKPKVVLGHFEVLTGKIKDSVDGIPPSLFTGVKYVYSGHYHSRSVVKYKDGEVRYIGSCYHLNRSDIGEERGFSILDTDTFESELVKNNEISIKFVEIEYPQVLNADDIRGNMIDLKVDISKEGYNEKEFNDYVAMLESLNPSAPPTIKVYRTDIRVIEDFDMSGATSTKEILIRYVKSLKYDWVLEEKILAKIELLYRKLEK